MKRPFLFLAGAGVASFALLALAPGSDLEFAEPIPIVPIDTVYRPATTTTIPAAPPTTPAVAREAAPTTTTTLVPPDALCGAWWVTALAVGWPAEDLATLDRVLYNESRCTSGLRSSTGDLGLAQLNAPTWRHLWQADGFTDEAVRDNAPLNLHYALQVANAATAAGWCRWEPWHGFSGDYC